MRDDVESAMRSVHLLMDDVRTRCLWSLRTDYYPSTPVEAVRVLETIERHGDLATFKKAAVLRQWLSRHTSSTSAV